MAVKSNIGKWASDQQFLVDRVEQNMAGVILSRAIVLAPEDTGMLHTSGRIIKNKGRSVVFGYGDVPYARIQELGGITGRNYATKIIAKHYLQKAGESVAKEPINKYIELSR